MKIYSFIKQGIELVPVEVEVSLLPGLPQFQMMGLPDPMIRESQLRIKSALKHQGFDIPSTHQVLIHLKPSYLKKTSRGLDLAIAFAFLWKTGQLDQSESFGEKVYVYGELSLDGKVTMPDDLDSLICLDPDQPVVSGPINEAVDYPIYSVSELTELSAPQWNPVQKTQFQYKRPELPPLYFCKEVAELMAVVAAGEHSLMLAGPSGSGKTTVSEGIHKLLPNPTEELFRSSRKISKLFGKPIKWRPFVNPHHTTPVLSMIGGGVPAFPGEITRAHGGALVLDEFLEFKPLVQEGLREPIEKGEIIVSRRGKQQVYPAQFQLIGTTNLCPCGDYVPGKRTNCRYSLTKCRSYMERLSGPILDRFECLGFSDTWKAEKSISLQEIYEWVQKAQDFKRATRGSMEPNSRLPIEMIEKATDDFNLKVHFPEDSISRRRRQAFLRVARTLADLESSAPVTLKHLEKSRAYTLKPFFDVKHLAY